MSDQKFLILSESASLYLISRSLGLFSKFIIFPKGEHVSLRAPKLVVTTSQPAAIDSIAAISLGVKDSDILLDLDYAEDSTCDTDMNIVMTGSGKFVEIQGTAEGVAFTRDETNNLIDMAEQGIKQLTVIQNSLILLD